MASHLEVDLTEELLAWEAIGRRRSAPEAAGGDAPLADFSSNDYLGLSRNHVLVEAARRATAEHGAGGRASRLLGGGSTLHAELEREAAAWLGAGAALLYPTGYQANVGLLAALARRGDAVLSDASNHASLIDGARLSRARVLVHAHLDLDELEANLRAAAGARRRFVVTESVFSMDGDLAPLAGIDELCRRHDAWLVVDEAHAAGLLGPEGAGAWARLVHEGLESDRLVARVVTGGKALGAGGALVAGSATLREYLVNRSRAFVYTTAPPPATVGALRAAVELVRESTHLRHDALERARELARRAGLPPPEAAIVPFVVGPDDRACNLAESLRLERFDVRAVRPPTVPEGSARLRLVCHAFNEPFDVDRLGERLAALAPPSPRAATVRAPAGVRFVVGTDTGVGKTVVAAAALRALRRHGPARYWKPVQTGAESDTRAVAALARAESAELCAPAYELALAASPDQAAEAEGVAIDPERVERRLAALRAEHAGATLVVELAGGLCVPYAARATQADLVARAGEPAIVVARSGLGTLNHTMLTLEALRARGVPVLALVLSGEPHAANRATLLRDAGVPRVLELPPLDPLDGGALERWIDASELDAVLLG